MTTKANPVPRSVWKLRDPGALHAEWIITGRFTVRTGTRPEDVLDCVRIRYLGDNVSVMRYELDAFLELFRFERPGH